MLILDLVEVNATSWISLDGNKCAIFGIVMKSAVSAGVHEFRYVKKMFNPHYHRLQQFFIDKITGSTSFISSDDLCSTGVKKVERCLFPSRLRVTVLGFSIQELSSNHTRVLYGVEMCLGGLW